MAKRYLTPEEVGEILIVPQTTLYKWRYSGTGPPSVKFGKYLRFPADEFERWVSEREAKAS